MKFFSIEILQLFWGVLKSKENLSKKLNIHTHHNLMRKISSGKYIKSMRISVTNENDELIDSNGLSLRFEFEII